MVGEMRFSADPTEFVGKRVLVTGGTTAHSPLQRGQAPDLFMQADLGTASGVQQVVDRVQHEWGRLDVLVDNVCGTGTKAGGFEALSDEDWQNILNVNLLAAVRLDRAFIPGMTERR
jgi:NAD(P)-dependent dehydrogenase (short-subunit alcohol dehydrogenase family)